MAWWSTRGAAVHHNCIDDRGAGDRRSPLRLRLCKVFCEPIDHSLEVFLAEFWMGGFSESVGATRETDEFDSFALTLQGYKELFGLFDRTTIVFLTVHQEDRCLDF